VGPGRGELFDDDVTFGDQEVQVGVPVREHRAEQGAGAWV
jgi:hypothetical protein